VTNEVTLEIPLEKLDPAFEVHLFGLTKLHAFHADDKFRVFPCRLKQTTRLVKFFEQHYQATPSDSSLARAFNVHPLLQGES
jgi:hypothetical protein